MHLTKMIWMPILKTSDSMVDNKQILVWNNGRSGRFKPNETNGDKKTLNGRFFIYLFIFIIQFFSIKNIWLSF